MIERILNFSVTQRFFVVLLVAALAAFGVRSLQRLPIDAVPDITNNQVQINTDRAGAVARARSRSRSRSRSRRRWPASRGSNTRARSRATASRR